MSAVAVRHPGRHRGLLRSSLDPPAAPRPHPVPRRAGHEHASSTRPRTTRWCAATGGCRTTARRSTGCASCSTRCRDARDGPGVVHLARALDPLFGRRATWRRSPPSWTASRRSGSTRFGLLLDDIPLELQHRQDRRRVRRPRRGARAPRRPRVRRTSRRAASWSSARRCTGAPAPSRTSSRWAPGIDPADRPVLDRARRSARRRSTWPTRPRSRAPTSRPPTYWDNYPVNDVAMGYELHIGPYRGRDPRLWRSSAGIVANGMELFESSGSRSRRSPTTCGDPEGYDPEASWRARHARRRGRRRTWRTFALFADNVRSSCLADDDAPHRGPGARVVLGSAWTRVTRPRWRPPGTCARWRTGCWARRTQLLRGPVANRALIDEARPWLEAFELGARADPPDRRPGR